MEESLAFGFSKRVRAHGKKITILKYFFVELSLVYY